MTALSYFAQAMQSIGGFEARPALAVAVSGGPDSMALCLLAHSWAQEKKGSVVALTVDHNLRPESKQEAIQVGKWLAARGIEHHILRWENPPEKNIQQLARNARYDLMESWCKRKGVLHLLTAHHQDDQVETLMQRTWRGSGIEGLAGIAAIRETRHIRLLRPLLHLPKVELENYLQSQKQEWIEDSSNVSPAYERNRLRQELARFPDDSPAPSLLSSCKEMAIARLALEHRLAQWMSKEVEISPLGFALVKESAFQALNPDMGIRVLAALITTISGEAYPPRHEKLAQLCTALCRSPFKKVTLGCCLISRSQSAHSPRYVLFSREPKAVELPVLVTENGQIQWDKRFLATLSCKKSKNLSIGALGAQGIVTLKRQKFSLPRYPHFLLSCLPALRRVDKILCVPHIGYTNTDFNGDLELYFEPVKPLAGTGFYITLEGLTLQRTLCKT